MPPIDLARLDRAYETARAALLAQRAPEGHWVGELSSSALSTATAVSALALLQKVGAPQEPIPALVAGGLCWLVEHQNADGGWGDTDRSLSNISTTMLFSAAFHLTGTAAPNAQCVAKAHEWLAQRYGRMAEDWAEAVRARYGRDRTFSVPILMTAALAGLVSWKEVPALPFELACFPQSWFRFLRLPVVSYALPALIAIGLAIYHQRPPRNPLTRVVRKLSVGPCLRVLRAIQPPGGGFLEATPLTSFVALGLAASGHADHAVARQCVDFLIRSARADGSWPIDTNLSTWVTTLAINALATGGELPRLDRRAQLRDWVVRQQHRGRHPYTGAEPGGWAWTPLPGGVPDADDTSGAILALVHLSATSLPAECGTQQAERLGSAPTAGIAWLLSLQNRDGGWPTFCRGWGKLAFDRSGPDLTAHALRALDAPQRLPGTNSSCAARCAGSALARGLGYLADIQRPDGSWLALWFGNQHAAQEENPTYGTARVLAAYRDLQLMEQPCAQRGVAWLLAAQNDDGGWGAGSGTPSGIEETALAVEALLDCGAAAEQAARRGLEWLTARIEAGGLNEPTPIGLYFAKLWYYEKLYPIVFAVAALGRARQHFGAAGQGPAGR